VAADSNRGYVSAGADPYVDREGRPGNVASVLVAVGIFLLLVVVPAALFVAAGGTVGDAVLGCGFFAALIVGMFGWEIYDDNRQSPDQVRFAIDAAGIYLRGSRRPARKPGRIPWSAVAEVVLSTRRSGLPPFPYLHIEVRLKNPLPDEHGRAHSVIGRVAHADAIAAAIRRHAPGVRVRR
jgi:hypothetical protein